VINSHSKPNAATFFRYRWDHRVGDERKKGGEKKEPPFLFFFFRLQLEDALATLIGSLCKQLPKKYCGPCLQKAQPYG